MTLPVRSNIVRHFPRIQQRIARWIVGRDAYGNEQYLMHNAYPMFVAKIARDDGLMSRLPFGRSRPLRDFVWLDPCPDEVAFLNLMCEAEDALEAYRRA